jgi:Ser/Thr protein kinase RdoA (MazF antagonist)
MNYHAVIDAAPQNRLQNRNLPQLLEPSEIARLLLRLGLPVLPGHLPRIVRLFPRAGNGSIIQIEADADKNQVSRYFVESNSDSDYAASVHRRFDKQRQRLGGSFCANQPMFDSQTGVFVRKWGCDELIDGLAVNNLQEWVRRVIPDDFPGAHGSRETSIVAHRLNRRAVVKWGSEYFVKLYKKGSSKAERALKTCLQLRRTAFNDSSPVVVSEVVSLLNGWPGFVVKAAGGTVLDLNSDLLGFELAGEALARLHRLPLRVEAKHGIDEELAILRDWVARVTDFFPMIANQYWSCLSRVESELTGRSVEDYTLVHRDFHLGQLLVDHDRATVLDFDTLSNGEPAQDVGNFIAHLEWAAQLQGVSCEAQKDALLGRYLRSFRRVDTERVRVHRNATLLRLACIHVFSTQFRSDAPRLLELVK